MEEIDSIIASLHLHNIEADAVAAPNTAEVYTEPVPLENHDFVSSNYSIVPNATADTDVNSLLSPAEIQLNEQQWHSLSTGVDVSSYNEHCTKLATDQLRVLMYNMFKILSASTLCISF